MKSIREIISSRRFLGGVDILNLMMLDYIWKKDFSDFSSMCEIYSVEKNILILKAKNSVFMNEIKIRKESLTNELNKYFRRKFIKDIKVIS
ncbi:MAG: DciA family protein [Elusimicrobiales bacterium]